MFIVGSTAQAVYEYEIGIALKLGTGSFASTDVGKTISINSGSLVLTATTGTYSVSSALSSTDTAASGAWSMNAVVYDSDNDVLEVSKLVTGFDIANASYDSVSFSVSSQETSPSGIAFNTDGTKMYIVGYSGVDVNEYALSTGFNISTASYTQNFSVASQESTPLGLAFNTDGTKMYITGQSPAVNEYALSTGFDVSTASYTRVFSVSAQETSPRGIAFNVAGTKMFIVGGAGVDVNEYALSTGFNISTASYTRNFSVSSQESGPTGLAFNTDGTKMYITGQSGDEVNEYALSTGFDLSTASFTQNFSVIAQANGPYGLVFNTDGTKMFIVDKSSDTVYQYSTISALIPTGYQPCISGSMDSTYWTDINSLTATNAVGSGNVLYALSNDAKTTWNVLDNSGGVRPIAKVSGGTWQYNSASILTLEQLSNAVYETTGTLSNDMADFIWRSSGNILFILSNSGDYVRKYTASTPYDMSTLTLSQSFSVGGQEIYLGGLFVSADGLHMYVTGNQGNDVNEYTLTTAFDLSTASYTAVGASTSNLGGLYFKEDGTKMYLINYASKELKYYTLSTAWSIATASYVSSTTLTTKSAGCTSIVFNAAGTSLFVNDNTDEKVYKYLLSTAWDISTLTYSQQMSFATQTGAVDSLVFNANGSVMWLGSGTSWYKYTVSEEGYTSSTTWVNATVNTEVQALRDSMGVSPNQMNSTKLNAITDANQITLGTDLDFAAILYLGSGTTVPTYSGTAINYDAAILNQGAILGTDYNYDAPASNKVRVTAVGAANLKIRVV